MFLNQADAQPVALCEVDGGNVDRALTVVRQKFGEGYTCQTTKDWREVIARNDIDSVQISTPDHWHVLMSIAMREPWTL
jgi:hypothetical protein